MDKIKRIAKGYFISILLFTALSMLGAVILKLTPFPDEWSFYYLLLSMSIACLFLGAYIASYFGKAGLVCGLSFSLILVLSIILLVSLSFTTFISLTMLQPMYLVPIALGGIGGIAGANMNQ